MCYLVGWQAAFFARSLLGLIQSDGFDSIETLSESGCAAPELIARGAPGDEAVILAMAAGREPFSCFDDDGIIGPPTRLQTAFVFPDSLFVEVVSDFEIGEPIIYLDVVPRPGGAWVLWQSDGSISTFPPPVFAMAVDDFGFPTGQSFEALPGGYLPPYGVAPLRGVFALA